MYLYVMWNLPSRARGGFHQWRLVNVPPSLWVWGACPERSPAEPKAERLGRSGGEAPRRAGGPGQGDRAKWRDCPPASYYVPG